MEPNLLNLATDIATYAGAVSAGISANALTGSAKSVIERVRGKLSKHAELTLPVSQELVAEIARILQNDDALLQEASVAIRGVKIDRSIIMHAETITDVRQVNN